MVKCQLLTQTLIGEENDAEVSQRCVYWDIDLGEWSDEGCKTEKMALEGMVSCRCSHLTSFAVFLVCLCCINNSYSKKYGKSFGNQQRSLEYIDNLFKHIYYMLFIYMYINPVLPLFI